MTKKNTVILISAFILSISLQYVFMLAGKGPYALTGCLKGADYIAFYAGGKMVETGQAKRLYNTPAYKQMLRRYPIVGNQIYYTPLYTPLMYYFYAAIAFFPFELSIAISNTFYILLYLFSVWLILQSLGEIKDKWKYLMLSALFPPFFAVFLTGQPSILYIGAIAAAFYLAHKKSDFGAGIMLAFLAFKPNLFAIALGYTVVTFRWKQSLGMLTGLFALLGITGFWDQFDLWKRWLAYTSTYQDFFEMNKKNALLWRQHSTSTFLRQIYPADKMPYLLQLIAMGLGAMTMAAPLVYRFLHKKAPSVNRDFFFLTLILALANPHFFDYDAVILVLPLMISFNYFIRSGVEEKRFIPAAIIFLVLLVGLVFASMVTNVQVTVPVLWAMLIAAVLKKEDRFVLWMKGFPENILFWKRRKNAGKEPACK